MFSNRSVSVQPSAPPIEYGGVPEARSVCPAFVNCGHVAGAFTPAFLKACALYQTVDLLLALKTSPYAFLLKVPSEIHAGEKFWSSTPRAYVIGFSAFLSTNCFTRPGCAMSAMSGGFPPATAVESTVGRLSPTGL